MIVPTNARAKSARVNDKLVIPFTAILDHLCGGGEHQQIHTI